MAGRIRIILYQFRVAVDAARKPLTVFGFTDRADHSAASLLHPTLPGGPRVPSHALSFAPHFSLILSFSDSSAITPEAGSPSVERATALGPHSLSARDMGRRARLR